ncbi:MAG: hypothetical protein DAHOPDDO_01648 [Ignavibacteriaceae bacterium]|nr:hypothetical protein [Ignavibacteriaceae bacterium]
MILNEKGNVVEEEWLRTKELRKNVDLNYYVIMPNHLHGIIIIEQTFENGRGELNSPKKVDSGRIQYVPMKNKFKSPSHTTENVGATRQVAQNNDNGAIQRIAPTKQTLISNSLGSIIGQFKSKVTKRLRELSDNSDLKIWQRNYYEHIIRNEIDLQNIRKYITLNPLKWEIDEYFNS